jgi:FkbM family methyltransferase
MTKFFSESRTDSPSTPDSPPGPASIANLGGVKIPLDLPVLSDNILESILSGEYEYQEQRQLPGIVKPGERVLELGVGIGFIASMILKHENTQAYLGFEANPDLLPCIREVFELNGVDGEICNAVLIHDPDVTHLDFYKRRHFWGSSLSPEPWAYESKVAIPARQFNSVIAAFRPTLIVCDIEGGELEVFRQADLSGVKRIYLEIHQSVLGRQGIRELFDILGSKNFHYDQFHSTGAVVLFTEVNQQ